MRCETIFKKLHKNRKANAAPALTIGFVLFNIFVYILIQSFADDFHSAQVGTSSNVEELANKANSTGTSVLTTWNDINFIRQAGFVINELPWWLTLILGSFQLIFGVVVILSWVRGL